MSPGTSNWKDIRKRIVKPEDEPLIANIREQMAAELQLAPIRKQRKASQSKIAKRLAVSQSSVSQLECRERDMKLSTLAGYIGALGGHVELTAVFDDETIPIGGFGKFTVSDRPKRRSGASRVAGKRVKGDTTKALRVKKGTTLKSAALRSSAAAKSTAKASTGKAKARRTATPKASK